MFDFFCKYTILFICHKILRVKSPEYTQGCRAINSTRFNNNAQHKDNTLSEHIVLYEEPELILLFLGLCPLMDWALILVSAFMICCEDVRSMPFFPILNIVTSKEAYQLHAAEPSLFLLCALNLYKAVTFWYRWHYSGKYIQ